MDIENDGMTNSINQDQTGLIWVYTVSPRQSVRIRIVRANMVKPCYYGIFGREGREVQCFMSKPTDINSHVMFT